MSLTQPDSNTSLTPNEVRRVHDVVAWMNANLPGGYLHHPFDLVCLDSRLRVQCLVCVNEKATLAYNQRGFLWNFVKSHFGPRHIGNYIRQLSLGHAQATLIPVPAPALALVSSPAPVQVLAQCPQQQQPPQQPQPDQQPQCELSEQEKRQVRKLGQRCEELPGGKLSHPWELCVRRGVRIVVCLVCQKSLNPGSGSLFLENFYNHHLSRKRHQLAAAKFSTNHA